MSDESIELPSTSNKMLNHSVGTKARVTFNWDCLKQEKNAFSYGKIVKVYIVYEIYLYVNTRSYPTQENCFFGAVKLTKHVDIDLYKYSGFSIRFERKRFFNVDDKIGRHVIIFGIDMSSSLRIDKKKKYVLIFGKDLTQGLELTLA